MTAMNRRTFLKGAAAGAAILAGPSPAWSAQSELDGIRAEIGKRHDEAVRRLQEWIRQPSIAAENRGVSEGCDLTIRLLREAGFDRATRVPTDGQPGIFATLDAGAARTVGIYLMYDVKQVDPAEWSSPPWEAALVDKPGLGKVLIGRGAVNQKGPQSALLAALHALRGAGRKVPVNLVLVAEGEEEIGSPHFGQIVRRPEVQKALSRCNGIFMPSAAQGLDGIVTINLGAKGIVELELTASGERWGRGPRKDIHSSNKARVDSPAWHLVHALTTLVSADGNEPAIEGFAHKARPVSAAEKAMIAEGARRMDEEVGRIAVVFGVLAVEERRLAHAPLAHVDHERAHETDEENQDGAVDERDAAVPQVAPDRLEDVAIRAAQSVETVAPLSTDRRVHQRPANQAHQHQRHHQTQ